MVSSSQSNVVFIKTPAAPRAKNDSSEDDDDYEVKLRSKGSRVSQTFFLLDPVKWHTMGIRYPLSRNNKEIIRGRTLLRAWTCISFAWSIRFYRQITHAHSTLKQGFFFSVKGGLELKKKVCPFIKQETQFFVHFLIQPWMMSLSFAMQMSIKRKLRERNLKIGLLYLFFYTDKETGSF